MPNAEVLKQKEQIVADLTEKLKNATTGVLVDYKGISVADDTLLRKEFRAENVHYTVVKNTLLRFAAKNAGLDDLIPSLEGTTALALSDSDAIAPAKVAAKYAEKLNKTGFSIKAGFMDGKVLDSAKVVELGKMPSKDQLLSMLCSALSGNIRGLAVALNAIAENKEKESA